MDENQKPNVLLIDIETSPVLGYTWGIYDQNVISVKEASKIICVSWKWLGEKRGHVLALNDFESYKPNKVDDKDLVFFVWNLLDKSNVVIAHNGNSFDIKTLNSRFLYYKLMKPSFYATIDTLKMARKHFRFMDNRLDSISKYLEIGEKNSPGLNVWFDCIKGDKKSWNKMKKYNMNDVILLEKIYLKLRPFMDNHPNMSLFCKSDDNLCPTCLSKNIIKKGFSITRQGIRQRFRCKDCGSWSSGRFIKRKILF